MTQAFEFREPIEFENQGSKIFGVIHRPIKKTKVPAVLFCHGLAGHKIGRHRMYVLLAEYLSKAGIASLRFDFRGSGDSEGDFGEMSLEGEVDDAMKALDLLIKLPYIDTDKIGIFGRSFGGAIAIIAAHRFGKIKSIALWAPVFNAVQWEEKWEIVQTHQLAEAERHDMMRYNGQLPSMSFYSELFSMNLDKELESLKDIPMLHIHGVMDPVVSIEHATMFEGKRMGSKAETVFIKLPHSDHDFTHPEEKLQAFAITTEWFANTLLKG